MKLSSSEMSDEWMDHMLNQNSGEQACDKLGLHAATLT
jgi:hypothetical protein